MGMIGLIGSIFQAAQSRILWPYLFWSYEELAA